MTGPHPGPLSCASWPSAPGPGELSRGLAGRLQGSQADLILGPELMGGGAISYKK